MPHPAWLNAHESLLKRNRNRQLGIRRGRLSRSRLTEPTTPRNLQTSASSHRQEPCLDLSDGHHPGTFDETGMTCLGSMRLQIQYMTDSGWLHRSFSRYTEYKSAIAQQHSFRIRKGACIKTSTCPTPSKSPFALALPSP